MSVFCPGFSTGPSFPANCGIVSIFFFSFQIINLECGCAMAGHGIDHTGETSILRSLPAHTVNQTLVLSRLEGIPTDVAWWHGEGKQISQSRATSPTTPPLVLRQSFLGLSDQAK